MMSVVYWRAQRKGPRRARQLVALARQQQARRDGRLGVVGVGVAEAEIEIEPIGHQPFALQIEACALGAALVGRVLEAAGRQVIDLLDVAPLQIKYAARCQQLAIEETGPWCRLRS